MMIRRMATFPEPVEWEDDLTDGVYTVKTKAPLDLKHIMIRFADHAPTD